MPRTGQEILRVPDLAHYVAGWPRPGDTGVVGTESDEPVGATWWRFLSLADGGYGYVADDVPEVAIGVRGDHRGRGVGEAMLRRLVERGRDDDLQALSLSVEKGNGRAIRLYERLGFSVVEDGGGAVKMLLRL